MWEEGEGGGRAEGDFGDAEEDKVEGKGEAEGQNDDVGDGAGGG